MVSEYEEQDGNELIEPHVDANDPSYNVPPLDEEEATEVAAPPVATEPPPEIPLETPEVQLTPDQIQQLQQQNEAYRQQAAQLEEAQRRQTRAAAATAYQAELENQGLLPEQARAIADRERQLTEQLEQQQTNFDRSRAEQEAKAIVARRFAQQHGVSTEELMMYSTPEAMADAAKTKAQLKKQEGQIAALTQSQVPSQEFEVGTATGEVDRSENSLLDAYNAGDRSELAVAAARRAAGA